MSAVEVEITCLDPAEHRRRVATRTADIDGHRLPTWQEVVERDYQPWDRERIVIDTAGESAETSARKLLEMLRKQASEGTKTVRE